MKSAKFIKQKLALIPAILLAVFRFATVADAQMGGVTTPMVARGNSSGIKNAFSSKVNDFCSYVSNPTQPISQSVRNVARTVSQAISTPVSIFGRFFIGLFGGHH